MPDSPLTVQCRVGARGVALETTLLAHGVPSDAAFPLADELSLIVREAGAEPAVVGILDGVPIVGMDEQELTALLGAAPAKANSANLGVLLHRAESAATTVSATMELASAAGVRVFATGGIGGVHRDIHERWDVSGDLIAFTRFPVCVVTSGAKSVLDVPSTREMLETLGVPVIGFRTDSFPAFYMRSSDASCDARIDDVDELSAFVDAELTRTGRGVVVCNPIPEEHEIPDHNWAAWIRDAEQSAIAAGATGRDVTPAVLGALHEVSQGKTLEANLALVRSNTRLAAQIACSIR